MYTFIYTCYKHVRFGSVSVSKLEIENQPNYLSSVQLYLFESGSNSYFGCNRTLFEEIPKSKLSWITISISCGFEVRSEDI